MRHQSARPASSAATFLHPGEVADLLHVSPKTVSRWAKDGKLPFQRTLGGHRRYPEHELRELAQRDQHPGVAVEHGRLWDPVAGLGGVAAGSRGGVVRQGLEDGTQHRQVSIGLWGAADRG